MLSATANSQAVKKLMQKVSNDVTFANGDQSAREEYIQQLNTLFTQPQMQPNLFPPYMHKNQSPKNHHHDYESINRKQSLIIQSIINGGGVLQQKDNSSGTQQ